MKKVVARSEKICYTIKKILPLIRYKVLKNNLSELSFLLSNNGNNSDYYCGWNICVSQKSIFWGPNTQCDSIWSGGSTLERKLSVDEVMSIQPLWWDWYPISGWRDQSTKSHVLPLSLSLFPACDYTAQRYLSINQKRAFNKNQVSDLQPPGLWERNVI